jgi:hypothetical protein
VNDQLNPSAVLPIEFHNCFPHKLWISDWSSPDGDSDRFRYKIMSARQVVDEAIQLVIVLENGDGTKDVLQDLTVRPEGFERVAAVFVSGLADEYGLDFEEQVFLGLPHVARCQQIPPS